MRAEYDLLAAALRLAASEMGGAIAAGDVAEMAAHCDGETGRSSAIESRDEAYEDPAGWLMKRADELTKLGATE